MLERDGQGLNLTEQVRDGILNHTGSDRPATLEGRIVKLVDRVAYINHDIDDALRAGILRPDDLPAAEIELLGPTGSARIDTLVRDIVERSAAAGDIVQSEEVGGAMLRLRKFMFDRVYLGEAARGEHERAHARPARPLRPLHGAPRGGAGGRAGGERVPAGRRLPRRDDRSLLHRPLRRADRARGGALLMALISEESLERVKQAADIVEVISAHTDLRRQGARWVGLCPFHEERTPSFSVDAQEKLYHCFGCGVGGDTIKFVEEKEGLGFAEAVELLADRYGVELEREKEDPRAEARRQQRRRLGELLDRTAGFYAQLPLGLRRRRRKARAYLAERGLGEEALRAFGVGYAPSAWDTVLLRGQRAGFKVEELRAVGLAQQGRSGGEYDRFRERIMFPIRDRRGRTLGFGGRAMRSDQGAKYVNTAETDFFHKSQMLYGIDLAKEAIAKSGRAVVVEGYTDVLALHQAGIGEAVGVMGTAITEEQVAALSGMVDEVVLALDADSAGQEAMLRAQRVAAGRKMRLRVAAMPAGEDPAEMMAAEGGAERFRALVEGAVDLPAFQVGLVLERTDVSSPAERDRALGEVAPILAGMGETASRDELVRRVAERLDLEPAMVMGRVTAAQPLSGGSAEPPRRGRGGGADAGARSGGELTSRERRERALLAMCIALPAEGREYLARLTEEHLSPSGARAAGLAARASRGPGVQPPPRRRPARRPDRRAGHPRPRRARLGRGDGAQLPPARAAPPRVPDRRRRRSRRLRAPRRPQPRARRPGRAHSPHRAGRELALGVCRPCSILFEC